MEHPRLKDERALFAMRHALQRAKERYGVRLTEVEYWALVDQCLAGNKGPARFVVRESKTRTVWWVRNGSQRQQLLAVYSNVAKVIVTFLPPNFHIRPRNFIEVMRRQ